MTQLTNGEMTNQEALEKLGYSFNETCCSNCGFYDYSDGGDRYEPSHNCYYLRISGIYSVLKVNPDGCCKFFQKKDKNNNLIEKFWNSLK